MFDLDGVLIDSTHVVARVWRNWAIEHGFNPDEVVSRAHGRPSIATIKDYLPNSDHEQENREVERREMEDLDGVVALPGALALLENLPPDRWAIVTSCTRILALVRIRAAGLPTPRHLLTSSDVTHGKPHPEPFLKGASMLGLRATDCVVFEDAPAGVRSGKAAGAFVIGLTTTMPSPKLQDAGADWVVRSCSDICLSASNGSVELVRRESEPHR